MGSIGDGGHGEISPNEPKSFNFSCAETQPVDIQFSPPPLPGDDEIVSCGSVDKCFPESMVLCHDSLRLEGEFETQIMNFEEETQVVNFDAETQLMDSQCYFDNLETQLVDQFDTQVIIDSDGEGSDRTEILSAGDALSDDNDSVAGTEKENTHCISTCRDNENRGHADTSGDAVRGSGSIRRGFTSIRAASLRASGLAARCNTQNGYNSQTLSSLSNRKCPDEDSDAQKNGLSFTKISPPCQKEVDQKDGEEVKDEIICRIGSSAVRRLFTDEDSDLDADKLHFGNENLVGLTYVDSQEPGDLSQANALDFVEQFIKANVEEIHQDSGVKRTCGGKPMVVSTANGRQSLARKATRVTNRVKGTFDWDDDLEDDCGGELFCRRKDDFFDPGSMRQSRTQPRKQHIRMSNEDADRKRPSSLPNKVKGRILSPSRLTSNVEVPGKNLGRDLADELVTGSTELLRGQSEDVYTVGVDTQLAAEAMEALCQEEGPARKDGSTSSKSEQKDKDGVIAKQSKQTEGNCRMNLPVLQLRSSGRVKKHQEVVKAKSKGTVRKKMEEMPSNILLSRNNSELGAFTPIARRTRLSKVAKEMQEEGNGLQMEMDGAVDEGAVKPKRIPLTGRRTRSMTGEVSAVGFKESDKDKSLSKLFCGLEGSGQLVPRRKRTRPDGSGANLSRKKQNKNPIHKAMPVEDKIGEVPQTVQKLNDEVNDKADEFPKEISNVSNNSVCITPVSSLTLSNDVSPVCAGNDYFKKSCKRSLSRSYLRKEIESLTTLGPEASPSSAMRRRRDLADVRVLYSHHLEDDIVKQQKKILARLGAALASSIADATHFVTDHFVRTRNMLEAIASGKPVVTHLWLESCGQANCFLDEKNYILRDAKKEKEIGFSMPVSLARACRHPLLQDQRVFITSNTKPDKGVISALVKAVGGQPTERIGRSALRDEKDPDDLLILSCEEDYDVCMPFLEKGMSVYSSELLLNGIVIQKLEYERHRLFADHVKKTRSTVWVKKDGKQFVPIARRR